MQAERTCYVQRRSLHSKLSVLVEYEVQVCKLLSPLTQPAHVKLGPVLNFDLESRFGPRACTTSQILRLRHLEGEQPGHTLCPSGLRGTSVRDRSQPA